MAPRTGSRLVLQFDWLIGELRDFLDLLVSGNLVELYESYFLVRLFGALVIVALGWYLSKLAVRFFARPIARRFQRPSVTRTVLRSVRLALFIVAILVAMGFLGLQVGGLLVSVTVFSAVLGVTLAPIVGSIISGLFVLADQPYEIGDMIELANRGQRGFVEDITLRYTKIFTLDNTFLVIPNSSIRNRDVINYSAEDERTRLSLQITVTYEGDLDEARTLIERAARNVDEVIEGGPAIRIGSARYPAGPTCYIDQFADHGVLLTLRYWGKQPYKLLTLRSKVQTEVWEALDDADVEFAYPHSHLMFDETSGQARVAVQDDGRPPGVDDPRNGGHAGSGGVGSRGDEVGPGSGRGGHGRGPGSE